VPPLPRLFKFAGEHDQVVLPRVERLAPVRRRRDDGP
jgi:hypothetical protein